MSKINLYNETKFIMKKYNIVANKKLGQNFLINEDVVDTIVNCAKITNEDLVIEIGPGLGTLTSRLIEKAGKVICIELDNRMINILKDRFSLYNNIEIIHEDVLKVDIKDLIKKEKEKNNIKYAKIVANLPYYITTPIIMKLLEDELDIESITIMIQKEVAQRICANPGSNLSGAITYGIHYYTIPYSIMEVDKSSFIPEPEVQSEVIRLDILKNKNLQVKDADFMFKIIKAAFMQRRKTLINALINGNIIDNKEKLENILEKLDIDKNIRGEKLTLEQFAQLSDKLCN